MSQRLLVIPGYRLYPIETGAGVAQYGIIDDLRKRMEVSLLIDRSNVPDPALDTLKHKWPEVTFLHWTELKSKWEQGSRPSIMQRIKDRLSPRKPVIPPSGLHIPEPLRPAWENCSILFYDTPDWRIQSLQHHLSQVKYDVVQTDLPVSLPLIAGPLKGMSTLHVCHEWKHKRFQLSAETLRVSEVEYRPVFEVLRQRELELIKNYDHCIFFSEEDASLLPSTISEGHVSPFPVLDQDFLLLDRGVPRRLIFIGPEHHGPNKEAVDRIWSEYLDAVPDGWTIHIIGKWSEEYQRSHGDERLLFEGYAPDLRPFYEESIMIVPIESGAGIRTKILQAMAAGVPVAATKFAAEGIGAVHGQHIHYFHDAETLSSAIDQVREDQRRTTVTASARALIRQRFSQDHLGQNRADILDGFNDD